MPDIYTPIQPADPQPVDRMPVPFSRYLSTAFDAGVSDSVLQHLNRIGENHIDNADPTATMLTKDQANQQYGVGDLKFDGPVNSTEAKAMHDRETAKMDRDMVLASGYTKGRLVPGMVMQTIGATANPVDFGSMFIPFTGEAKIGKLAFGLRDLAKMTPAPKVVEAMMQGTAWQATVGEIPRIVEAHQENVPVDHVISDVVGQAGFAALLHGAGVLLSKMSPRNLQETARNAMSQWLNDEDVRVQDMPQLDEHVQAYDRWQQYQADRADALKNIDFEGIRKQLKDEKFDYPEKPAIRNTETNEVASGYAHWMIPENATWPADKVERGYLMKSGRYMEEEAMFKEMGLNLKPLQKTSEYLLRGMDLGHQDIEEQERAIFEQARNERWSDEDLSNALRRNRQQNRVDAFFARPDIQEEMKRRQEAAIADYIDSQKKADRIKAAKPEVKEMAAEKTIPDEEREKWNGDDETLHRSIKDDIGNLEQFTPKGRLKQAKDELNEHVKNMGENQKDLAKQEELGKKVQDLKKEIPEKVEEPDWEGAIDSAINCTLEKIT